MLTGPPMVDDPGSYILLFRKFRDWQWYTDTNTKALFLHFLIAANYKTTFWREETIERGQLLTGLNLLHTQTGLSVQSIRTSLKKLEKTGEIKRRATNEFSIITICNYEKYHGENSGANKQINKRATNEQQTTNKRLTTSNTLNTPDTPKAPKKKRRVFDPSGKKKYFDHVYLDEKQLESVKQYYQKKGLTWADCQEAMRELDRWFDDNPNKRKTRVDDAKALKGWPLDKAIRRKKDMLQLERQEMYNYQAGRKKI